MTETLTDDRAALDDRFRAEQEAGAQLLLRCVQFGPEHGLPSIEWSLTTTGTVAGYIDATRQGPAVWQQWADALRLTGGGTDPVCGCQMAGNDDGPVLLVLQRRCQRH